MKSTDTSSPQHRFTASTQTEHRRGGNILCFLSGLAFILFLLSLSSHGASETPEFPAASISDAANTTNVDADGNTEHVFIRLLPDTKQLLAQPGVVLTTVLDIGKTYRGHAEFKDVSPVFQLVDSGKTKVVQPTLHDDQLSLQWKQIGDSEITIRAFNPATKKVYDEKIYLEAWMPNYWTMFFAVVGGLGIFLVGMKYMSEGLQMVAGASLRRMIATLTDNRFSATLVGFVVTFLIQSSSVTTVMVVGFINSQIMTLSQGIGVIMGANIGTTVTGWILTLNIGKYGLPILGIAAFFYMFSKNERTRFLGMAVMGLGFVFFGLELMQQGFKPLRDLPSFSAWMETFSADSYFGVLTCAAVGCILTLVVQSSSATLGITISLAAIGVIRFETAAALVLGENIGTTITAVLASIGMSANARRAAYFHVMFNVIGVAYITMLFNWPFMPIVRGLVGVDPQTGLILNSTMGIALTHTLFNVANVIVFLPFTRIAADILIRYVPDTGSPPTKSRLTNLSTRIMETASISVERSRIEVLRMGTGCNQLTDWVLDIVKSETPESKMVDDSFHQEEVLDSLQDEIIEFTSSMLSGNISHDIAESARQQLRMADELESISDYLIIILKSDLKMRQSNLSLPEPEKSEVIELHGSIGSLIRMIVQYYAARKSGHELMTDVHAQGRSITHKVKSIRDKFMRRMSEEKFDPQVVIAINTQLNAYRRVREHAQNVAEAIVGVK